MPRVPATPASETEALVRSVAHEVGNLLAAVRLEAGIGDPDAGPRIAELAARAGTLISLLSPLLAGSPRSHECTRPEDLLERLRAALDDPGDPRLEVDPTGAESLPALSIEPGVIEGLVLAELFAALAELPSGGRLRVGVSAEPGRVALVLEGPGRDPAPEPRVGRALSRALAARLLAARGGEVRHRAAADSLRLEFVLPAPGSAEAGG